MSFVTLNLPNDLNDRLDHLVQQTGLSADFHFQRALESYLTQTSGQNVSKKREVPAISAEDLELFGKIYQTSGSLDEHYFFKKLGIKP